MKLLVLGKGAREHAFAKKFANSDKVSEVIVSPGNPGMEVTSLIQTHENDEMAHLLEFCKEKDISNVFIGSEDYLAKGYKNFFSEAGFKVIGPNMAAANLESSKAFCKKYLEKAKIPTAKAKLFHLKKEMQSYCDKLIKKQALVLKWDHLAGGKGVFVCHNEEQLNLAYEKLDDLKGDFSILVEDFLNGKEVSAFTYIENGEIYYFGSACDYKRRSEKEDSPNTGGMGAFSPNNKMAEDKMKNLVVDYSKNILEKLKEDQIHFEGFLFWGLMLEDDSPYVLEINVRFGDPEAQAILPRIENDLATFFFEKKEEIQFLDKACVHLVKVDPSYPYKKSIEEEIVFDPDQKEAEVYFSGTVQKGQRLFARGGRILGISVLDKDLESARKKLYQKIDVAKFDKEDYREDIGC